jgi:DNA polymerase III epsilon subunit-like protein
MVSWADGRLVAYDCETTGVNVEKDRIVTGAIAICGGGQATETLSVMADPGIEIPEEAVAVHGITTERARAEGTPARDVVSALLESLRPYAGHAPIVAMNARFDLTILDREARRYGLEPLEDLLVVDPLVIDKHLDRFRPGKRKLDALCLHYGAGLGGAHDATHDAIAAARVAWVIGQRGQVVRRVRNPDDARELGALKQQWDGVRGDLRLLHAAQVDWAREQALSLADYFRKKGQDEDADSVRTDWPIVAFREEVAV